MKTDRYLYLIPCQFLSEEMSSPFYFSDLNENAKELPNELLELIKLCKEIDCVYTIDNFMLCYNLQDSGTVNGENYMFVPDIKFKKQIQRYLKN